MSRGVPAAAGGWASGGRGGRVRESGDEMVSRAMPARKKYLDRLP